MIKIRIHGRGGQGGKKLASMIASAVSIDGKYIQAFAVYGAERSGAPVMSFVRINDKKVLEREYIADPDIVIVLDKTLFQVVKVTDGLTEKGLLIINSDSKIEIDTPARIKIVDAKKIAMEVIKKPIFNTAMLGAFAKLAGIITLENAIKGAEDNFEGFPQKVIEANIEAIKKAYEVVE